MVPLISKPPQHRAAEILEQVKLPDVGLLTMGATQQHLSLRDASAPILLSHKSI